MADLTDGQREGELMGEPIPSVISEEVKQDMDNIWSVFDKAGENKVPIKELKTIMRALDVNVDHPSLLHQIK